MTMAKSKTQTTRLPKPQPHFVDRLKAGARQRALQSNQPRGESCWPKTGVFAERTILVAYYPASNRYNFWLAGQLVTQRELISYLEDK